MLILSVSLTCRFLTGQWRSFSSSVYNPYLEVLQRCNRSANNSPCKQTSLCKALLEPAIRTNAASFLLVSFCKEGNLSFLSPCIMGQLIYCAGAAGQWWRATLGGRLPGCVRKEAWKGGPVSRWPSIFLSPDLYCQGGKKPNNFPPTTTTVTMCLWYTLLQVCCCLCSSG